MKRRGRILRTIAFPALVLLFLQGCWFEQHYAPGSPESLKVPTDYRIGQHYRLKMDLFLIRFHDGVAEYEYALFYPASYKVSGGAWPALAPASTDEYRQNPKKWPRVAQVLPAGATIRFLGIWLSKGNPEAGDLAIPIGIIDEGQFVGQQVSLDDISLRNTANIDRDMLEEVDAPAAEPPPPRSR